MKYTEQQLLEIKTQLNRGALWHFIVNEFLGPEARLDQAQQAADMLVSDLATQNLRDRTLAKVAVLKELVDLIPARVDTLLHEVRENSKT